MGRRHEQPFSLFSSRFALLRNKHGYKQSDKRQKHKRVQTKNNTTAAVAVCGGR